LLVTRFTLYRRKEVAMAKIISIEERRLLKAMQADVTSSITQLSELKRKLSENNDSIRRYTSLNDWMTEIISGELMRRNQLTEDIFLCGMYIAAMLAAADCDLKKYAVDFLEQWSNSSDPKFLKMGGDFCFVLCGGFAPRCDRRMMRMKDYQELGASFYDWFYTSTGKVIGHYMSVNFQLMQDVVSSIFPKTSSVSRF
jgi:hypothetical protein